MSCRTVLIFLLTLLLVIFTLMYFGEDLTVVGKNTLKNEVRSGTDIMEDLLFKDVIMYQNDYTMEGELGLEKCIKDCKGRCVEYGVTGNTFCFPFDYIEQEKLYKDSIKNSFLE